MMLVAAYVISFSLWLGYTCLEGNGSGLNVLLTSGWGLHPWVNIHKTYQGGGGIGEGEGENYDEYDLLQNLIIYSRPLSHGQIS